RQKRFDIQYYPDSTILRIKKGQVIGRMGNSGSSNGAHLHFEIRETETEIPINPLLFGFTSTDKMAPGISYARIYDLDENFNEFNATNVMAGKRGQIFYPVKGDTITTLSPKIGLGINTRDGQEGNWNKNGVYDITMHVNDTLVYQITMDSVSFDLTRMINAHLDYPEQRLKKNYVHKCYSVPGNILPIIKEQKGHGVIHLQDNEKKKIKFSVKDFNGNMSVMEFYVKKLPGDPVFKYSPLNYFLPYNKKNIIQDTGINIVFTEKTFFKNQNFLFKNEKEKSGRIYSNMYTLGNPNIPVFDYYSCTMDGDQVPEHLKNKAFIASCDEYNRESNWGGTWNENKLTASLRAFGTFYITLDTIPPTVVPVVFGKNMVKNSRIIFRIDDNITPAGQTPYLNYQAFIDDIWIPMVYDLKTKTITYVFPKMFPKGEHSLRLEVFDALKNTKVYTSTFIK
ncbi:MAG TPA: M23 family metallopeptidase, partial [Saprospiraceae bacterium]|nr:M23 family metallopeptidase [Saprospiraceae bacterium]